MNILNIKKLALPVMAAAMLYSCDKAETTPQLEDNGQKLVRIVGYGGLSNYTGAALILDNTSTSQTVEFQVEYLGPQVLDQDLTVTLAVDDAVRVAWNADPAHADQQFAALPANMFTLNTTTAVIRAGEVFSDPISVTFNPSLFDPAESYMIPIRITNISGGPGDIKPAAGQGIAYFHIFGNPLAGMYDVTGYFYHPTAPRAFDYTGANAKVLAPSSPTVLLVELGDLGAAGYVAALETDPVTNQVTISAAPGAAGAPYTQFNDALPNSNPGYTPQLPGFPATANYYDPATQTFYLRYGYMGASGWRVTEEILVKQ